MDRNLKNDIKDYIIYSTLKAFVNCDEILWDINVTSYDGPHNEAYYLYYILNYVLNIHPPYYQELSLEKCRDYLENIQNAIDTKEIAECQVHMINLSNLILAHHDPLSKITDIEIVNQNTKLLNLLQDLVKNILHTLPSPNLSNNYIKLPDVEDSIFKSSSSIPTSETPNHALNNKDDMVVQTAVDTKPQRSTISPDNMEFDSQIIPLTSIIDSELHDDCDDVGWEVAAASPKRRPHARIRPLTALGGVKMTWSKYFLPRQGQEPGNDKKKIKEEDGGDGTNIDNSHNSRPKYSGRGRGGIWSTADEDKLMELVRLGGKDWCKYYNVFPFRTNVNLKDKYRQLEKCGRVQNYLEEERRHH